MIFIFYYETEKQKKDLAVALNKQAVTHFGREVAYSFIDEESTENINGNLYVYHYLRIDIPNDKYVEDLQQAKQLLCLKHNAGDTKAEIRDFLSDIENALDFKPKYKVV